MEDTTEQVEISVWVRHTFSFPQGAKPVCVAHGQPLCLMCARNPGSCAPDSKQVPDCSTYAADGMHWDTCRNRIRTPLHPEHGTLQHVDNVRRYDRVSDELAGRLRRPPTQGDLNAVGFPEAPVPATPVMDEVRNLMADEDTAATAEPFGSGNDARWPEDGA